LEVLLTVLLKEKVTFRLHLLVVILLVEYRVTRPLL